MEFDSSPKLEPTARLGEYAKIIDFVLSSPEVTKRFNDNVLALAKAFALVGGRPEAAAIRNDVRLFVDVRAAVLKVLNPNSGNAGRGGKDLDTALGQLLNEALTAEQVIDVYQLAGLETPELSLLSDEFLDSLSSRKHPNLQMGLLRHLLNDQVRTYQRRNIVQGRKYSELLEEAINRYTNRSLSTAEIIAELVKLSKQMRDEEKRHAELGLTEDEVAFYDAIVQNDAAVLDNGRRCSEADCP